MKLSLVSALALLVLGSALLSCAAATPLLIVRKQVLEYPVYASRDVTVSFRIFNVGESAAYDVTLTENGLNEATFSPVIGSTSVSWKSIPAGTSVTHTFVVKPKRSTRSDSPFYGYPAIVTFADTPGGDTRNAYSNDIGAFHIYQRGELTKRVKAPVSAWGTLAVLSAAVAFVPLSMWRFYKNSLPGGLPRGTLKSRRVK